MRFNKYTLTLVLLVLAFGFTSSPGIGSPRGDLESVLESGLISENGAKLKCSVQSQRSTVRSSGNGDLTVSVNSNWLCR